MGILRIFLAYIVILFHSPDGIIPKYFHPGLAVQCFFMISGFYMQLIIEKYHGLRTKHWQINFYQSRALRIFPLYFLVLLINIFVIYKLRLPEHLSTFVALADIKGATAFIFTNIFIFGQGLLRFFAYDLNLHEFIFVGKTGMITLATSGPASFHMMIPSWSIDLELMFYLLVPFLLLRSSLIIFSITFLSISLRIFLGREGYNLYSWSNCFFPSELAIFLLGSFSCRFYLFFHSPTNHKKISKFLPLEQKNIKKLLKFLSRHKTIIIYFLYFISLYYLLKFYVLGWHSIGGGAWNEGTLAVPKKYWMSLIVTALAMPFIFFFSKNIKFDQFVGSLSYPIYLLHPTVLFVLNDSPIDQKYHSSLGAIITTLISIVMVIFVESYITNYRHKKFLTKKALAQS